MKHLKRFFYLGFGCCVILILATAASLNPVTKNFKDVYNKTSLQTVLDRNGLPLAVSYQSKWNQNDLRPLYDVPTLLIQAFLISEDQNFYTHHGVDWRARGAAILQNIKHRGSLRGASTITEQIVRMLNPRPRNLWSKWVEGFEAMALERSIGKQDLLEFYLNQIPYAGSRRGVVQAARYYFNRDIETLTPKEMLALVVLARAPSAYDLYKHPQKIEKSLIRLSKTLLKQNILTQNDLKNIGAQSFTLSKPSLMVDARHFTRYALLHGGEGDHKTLRTTLDSSLQSQIQNILDARIHKLASKNVTNGGVLVMDHTSGDILAWVSAGAMDPSTKGGDIDPITTPRQPGSTLKPFLYAMALEKGWNAATFIHDKPIAEAVGAGLHRFRNYSGKHYGVLTLREALGNSLNIPAILTVRHVGVDPFFEKLHQLGFESLTRDSTIYDEGLALGNGEVTLLELTSAYAVLANRGHTKTPRSLIHSNFTKVEKNIFNEATTSIIGNILSDPSARMLEFGHDSILNLPARTAIKTGTSTDYRDGWAIGYNDKYVVGIWMGNLDRTPMKDVTGSTGPALALRSIFGVLNKNRDVRPIYQSPSLVSARVCTRPMDDAGNCTERSEIFANTPVKAKADTKAIAKNVELIRPTHGLMMAYDPRIPSSHQKFRFEVSGVRDDEYVEWILNDTVLDGDAPTHLWTVEKGKHTLNVILHAANGTQRSLKPVAFTVR